MAILIVVENLKNWPLRIPGVDVVSAKNYLTHPRYSEMRSARVFNLCRSYRYQTEGYYVSLLALARRHKPLPSVSTIQDMKSMSMVRLASEDLDPIIQRNLASIRSRRFTLSVYFGRNLAKRYDRLSAQLFRLFQAPLIRVEFARNRGRWQIQSIRSIAATEIPENHRAFVESAAVDHFAQKNQRVRRLSAPLYDLAILQDPQEKVPPSDAKALDKFQRAAKRIGMGVELIEKEDYARLPEFDALFIRATTSVNHYTYRFARRGLAEGLVVVDDPDSIAKCTNKVFLAELLTRQGIRVPATQIMHRDNGRHLAPDIGYPCILKSPDSTFSQGVVKVDRPDALASAMDRMIEDSELVIAQEFLPTPFDWRVGVFDRQVLFVCKYHMAPQHWQIVRQNGQGDLDYGPVEAIAVEHAPQVVVRTALKAANLIGDGLYGVDLKQIGRKIYVIEINENPNIDSGCEDRLLKDALYEGIMHVFLKRIRRRNGHK